MRYAPPTCCLRRLKDPSHSKRNTENLTFVKLFSINILNNFVNEVFMSKNTLRVNMQVQSSRKPVLYEKLFNKEVSINEPCEFNLVMKGERGKIIYRQKTDQVQYCFHLMIKKPQGKVVFGAEWHLPYTSLVISKQQRF